MYNFDISRPSNIADAASALGSDEAQALGGGQTLIPTLKARLASPETLVSLTGIGEMQGICRGDSGEVCIGGATCHADVAADDYFQGMFETALDEGEIITEVRFPVPEAAHYEKFVQPASRFAMVGVFVAKYADGVRVAVTGASEEGVFRWTEAEAALSANFSADALADLTVDADGMISDLHASSAYRAHLVKVITGRAVTAAA